MRFTCEYVLRGCVVDWRGVGLRPTKCLLRDVETDAFLFFRAKTGAAMAAPDAPKATALTYMGDHVHKWVTMYGCTPLGGVLVGICPVAQ